LAHAGLRVKRDLDGKKSRDCVEFYSDVHREAKGFAMALAFSVKNYWLE
jgi:hypothetical protein